MAYSRIVVKVGSSTLARVEGGIDQGYVSSLVSQLCEVRSTGTSVVLVSSGAILAGLEALGFEKRPSDMATLQAAAAVGQVRLIEAYERHFAERGVPVAQVLLTRRDTGHREAYLHARDTFDRLCALGAVPIVNENDTVAVDEIRFGDNDSLAALVATLVSADLVVLLSDIAGLYDADPRIAGEAQLLERVDVLTDDLVAAAGGTGSAAGSGGMATKVEAAKVLMKAGIPMVICDGRRPDVVLDVVRGKPVGTMFVGGGGSIGARKLWIALGRKPAGRIVIDDGACTALTERGKSLLPAGVLSVAGVFDAGDAVVLASRTGRVIGRGLVEISAAELDLVKGLRTPEIEAEYPDIAGKQVVHRDRLVIL